MMRRLSVGLLALTATACGARSELPDVVSTCDDLSIGVLGLQTSKGSGFAQWLTDRGAGVGRLQTTTDEPLTPDAVQPFDILVLGWMPRDYAAGEAATLAAWVSAGGGLVAMSGWDFHTVDDWHANSLIAPLEVAWSGPLLWGPVTDLAPHPITHGLSQVVFDGGFAITDLGGQASTRTPIAFLPTEFGTQPVGYAIQMGEGRAFVWGDEWIEFTDEPTLFPPRLWMQVLKWITSAKRCPLKPPP
jgi:hypothetical protein